jgi:DNA gyrase subunit B
MINGLKVDNDDEYYNNKEIELLLYALGINPDKYDPNKLRYGKIAICVDADDDGYHIALLILANLYRICPKFLEENRIYWLRSPLFIEQDKNGTPLNCWYTDEEFNAARGKTKGNIKRVKGLGQLNEKDLKATMFSTDGHQKMDKIVYSNEGIIQLCSLMGVDIEPRRDFVFSRIDFSKFGTI